VLNKVASATAFQVQNASNAVFTVDTSGNRVILGTASNITGSIQFQGSGGAGKLFLVGPTTPDTGNFTLTIPTITANANICTDNSICSGYASSASLTSGLNGKLNKGAVDTSAAAVTAVQGNLYAFTNSSSGIASGVLKLDNGSNTANALTVTGSTDYSTGSAYILVNNTNGTPTGNLIDLQANAADEFTVDAAGNVSAAGNISIASGKQYQINGTQISTSALSDGNTLAKLAANQTFSGNNTFSSASNSFTGDGSGLTNLNATNVATGTLNDGRLSSNVALLNRTGQSFSGDNTFAPTSNNAGTTIKQTSGTATSGSVLDVQTANGTSHFLQVTNAAANEGNVTLQSVGATRDLTLGSGSGNLIITAATNTITHSNSGLTIDINNGTDSTLTITNGQGGAVASLSVEGDVGVASGRVFKVGATSGAGITCSSNTFLQNATTLGGITTGGSCANAVTSISASGGSIANGASIAGNALTLGYADTSNPGLVSNTTQSFNGAKTFTNDLLAKSSSSTAFQVQNSSNRSIFAVDTSGSLVSIGNSTDGAQITLAATGNVSSVIRKSMIVNGTIAANDLVQIDTANAGQVKQAVASSTNLFGVATSATGSGAAQDIVISGIYQINANASGGTIAVGDTLVSSSTAGQATKSGSTTSSGSVIGLAMSTLSW
jgi:trimeric autotransporter adhesin